ncbi:MAG: hypothetical protein ACPGED_11350, partial [Flavobacteriales bacterium]
MKKFLCLFIACTGMLQAWTQNSWVMGDSTRFDNYFGVLHVEAGGAFRSNAFNNQLALKLVEGGKLDPKNIADIENDLSDMNRVGGDLLGDV